MEGMWFSFNAKAAAYNKSIKLSPLELANDAAHRCTDVEAMLDTEL